MKKKVFKVVGIVLAVVVAFIGIVIGIMAIQGKFKKQIVYPKDLVFEKTGYVEINDDSPTSTHLHSFTLTGTNGNKTVNRKTCYIRFADTFNNEPVFGNELITLCDNNFQPLNIETEGNFSGYYKINCNEPVYYCFKPDDATSAHYARSNYGRVVLEANDQTGMVKSNQLVFDVDRVVDEIKFQDATYNTQTDPLTLRQYGYQEKTLRLGNSFTFNFEVAPSYSLRPFSNKLESKVVELYYVENDPNSGTMLEYHPIDSAFASGVDFLTEEGGLFRFTPTEVGHYQFVYAVFDSFEHEANAPEEEFYYQRVQNNMVYSILDIAVTSETATSLEISESANLNFKLYEPDSMVLNSSAAGVRNNLKLRINDANTSELYNTFEFNTGLGRNWSNANIVFKSEDGSVSLTNYQKIGDNLRIEGQDYIINYGNINLQAGRLIESLTRDGKTYKATTGVAFIDNSGRVSLLSVGSYLDFVEKTDTGYQIATLRYEAQFTSRQLANSTCEIKVLGVPEIAEGNTLHLMALIVNADGSYVFASKECNISVSPLEYVIHQSVQLDVTYPNDIASYGVKNFKDIVEISGGTYTAGLLVTEQSDDGYSIDVLENCTYTINDTTYVLVGYLENGGFVNAVRARNLAKSSTTVVYLMQIKNAYLQSAEEFVNAKIENGEQGGFTFETSEIVAVYTQHPVEVENKYELVDKLVYNFDESTEYELGEQGKDQYIIKDGNFYRILENTADHKITVSSPIENMLSNIAGKLTPSDFGCYIFTEGVYQPANNALTVTAVEIVDGVMTITFQANSFDRISGKFVLGFVYKLNDDTNDDDTHKYCTPEIQLDSQAAQSIMFVYEGDETALPSAENAADMPTINATITGFNGEGYSFTYEYNGQPIEDLNALFNPTFTKNAAGQYAFVPVPAYGVNNKQYTFVYDPIDKSILTITQTGKVEINILKVGSGIIRVSCNSTESFGYIKIEITPSPDFVFQPKEAVEGDINVNIKDSTAEVTTNNNSLYLDSFINYSFGGTAQTDAKFFQISNVRCSNLNYYVEPTEDGNFEIKDVADNLYATVSIKNNRWSIERTRTHSSFNLSFDVSVATAENAWSINIQFNSAVSVELNSNYNATIYAGTNVLLAELINISTGTTKEYTNNSLFRISKTSDAVNFFRITYKKYQTEGADADETEVAQYFTATTDDKTVNITDAGYYIFTIYIASTESGENADSVTFNLIVKPNVVFSQNAQNEESAHTLVSADEVDLSSIVTLRKYKTNVTYGKGEAIPYDDTNLTDFETADYSSLQLENNLYEYEKNKNANILTLTEDKTKVKTLWLTDLDEVVNKEIKLTYGTTEFDLTVHIINKYKPQINGTAFEFSARNFATAPVSIVDNNSEPAGATLSSVTGQDFDFEVDETTHEFKLNQDLEERVSAALTFTFNISISGENHTLIYKNTGNTNVPNVSITLTPRTPKPKTAINPISNNTFDIINDVFEIDEGGDGIESIEVVAVTNSQIFATKVVGVKYTYGQTNNTTITFAEISGCKQTSTITYQITYTGGIVQYNHNVQITVKNRQTIEINYPYQDENFETHIANYFNVLTDDSATIDYINSIVNSFKYEPVNVGQTITFGEGSRRVEIFENGEKKENEIKSVEWVACTNTVQNMVTIAQDGNNFNATFNLELNTTSAFVVLKITSNSGNYKFYNIRIFNQIINSGTANVNSNNTWQINFDGSNGGAFYSHEGSAYKILGETFSDAQLSQFFKLRGELPNDRNFKLYLLEASVMSDEELDAYTTLGLNQFEQLNGKTLTTLPQFATLKIALIYFGSGAADTIVYLGNIEVYAQSNKGVSLKPAEGNAPSITNKVENVNNGEYVCTWMMQSSSAFGIPFTFVAGAHTGLTMEILSADGFEISEDKITLNGTTIISISQTDGTITRENFVRRAYSFDVKYIFTFADGSKLVLLVTFEMEQTTVPTGSQNYSVGYDVTRQAFVNTQEIDLWGYTGKLKLYVDGSESIDMIAGDENKELSGSTVTATYKDGKLTLTFVLSTDAYEFGLGIEYSGIIGATLNYNVTIAVDSSAYVYFPLSAEGSSASLPSTANVNDDAYSSANASSIQISSSMDVAKNINTFSIENTVALNELKIFTAGSSATLEVEYSQPEFVTLKYGAEGNTENKIAFAHSARNDVVVELIIKIKSGDAYFKDSTNADKTVHLFIKVPQTYNSLEAMYLTAGADHENVLSDQTITAIRSDLFGAISQTDSDVASGNIYNGSKIAMIDTKGNRIAKDLTALGFKDRNNANYIEIEPHTDQLVKEFTVNEADANDNDLKFPVISQNTNTTISLSNAAGIINLSYKYQIMKDIKDGEDNVKLLDGAMPNNAPNNEYIFSTTYSEETPKTQTIDYSFIINKKEATEKLSISELKIATLLDESNTAFYIKAIDAKAGESALTANEENRNPENNAIKYTIDYPNYILTITRTAYMEIAVALTEKPTSTATDEILTFDITFVGNGGDYKLNLNIYNCTLTTPETQTQTAGFDVAINFAEIIKSNVDGGTAFDDVKFEYEPNGTYVNYKHTTNEKLSPTNAFFSLEISEDENKGTVHLYTIAENATVNIRFRVILGGKIIGYVDQFIVDNCEFVYVLQDGNDIISDSASYAETYYLWLKSPYKNEEDARKFDKTITLMGGENEQPIQYNLGGQYYNDRLNITLRNKDSVIGVSSIAITLVDENGEEQPSPYCTIEKGGTTISLKFQKDFTGKVILKLSATTINGPFEKYLALDVLGYVTLKYSNNNTEDSILSTNGGNGYDSGKEVRLIDTSSVDQTTGLVISTTKQDADNAADREELYADITPVVSYVILPYQSGLHVAEAYAQAASAGRAVNLEVDESLLSINNNTFTLKHNLPTVPMSTQDNYVVIYCVQLTYFGLNTDTMDKYYVAYKVHNDVKLTPKGTPIDADSDLSDTSLKLFQYTVTYAVDGKNYDVYLASDNNIRLKDEAGTEYTVEGDINGNEITFIDKSNNRIKISDVSIDRPTVTITENGQQPKISNATRTISNGADTANVFFLLAYRSILEFQDFITNSYIRLDADQNSNYIGAENRVANLDENTNYLYYQLTSLGDGVFGINLIDPYKSASFAENNKLTLTDGKLFNNEFNCILNVMDKTSNDSILKTNLRLTTTNALTASGYTLNEMFKITLPEAENFRIIGIGSVPSESWISAPSAEVKTSCTDGSLVKTITYMGSTYNVYSATWNRDSKGIYSLSQVFYYIKTEATSIVTVNFDSGDSTLFIVENLDSKITVDNKICVYKNKVSGGLEMTLEKASSFEKDDAETNAYKANNEFVTFTDTQLSIGQDKLAEYQTAHPDDDFIIIQCTLKYNDISFTVRIQFKLPDVQA